MVLGMSQRERRIRELRKQADEAKAQAAEVERQITVKRAACDKLIAELAELQGRAIALNGLKNSLRQQAVEIAARYEAYIKSKDALTLARDTIAEPFRAVIVRLQHELAERKQAKAPVVSVEATEKEIDRTQHELEAAVQPYDSRLAELAAQEV